MKIKLTKIPFWSQCTCIIIIIIATESQGKGFHDWVASFEIFLYGFLKLQNIKQEIHKYWANNISIPTSWYLKWTTSHCVFTTCYLLSPASLHLTFLSLTPASKFSLPFSTHLYPLFSICLSHAIISPFKYFSLPHFIYTLVSSPRLPVHRSLHIPPPPPSCQGAHPPQPWPS